MAIKYLQNITSENEELNRVQANVAEAFRRVEDRIAESITTINTTIYNAISTTPAIPKSWDFITEHFVTSGSNVATTIAAFSIDNGITMTGGSSLRPSFEPGQYLAFLGRLSPEKGPEFAIRIARDAGQPLRMAAKGVALAAAAHHKAKASGSRNAVFGNEIAAISANAASLAIADHGSRAAVMGAVMAAVAGIPRIPRNRVRPKVRRTLATCPIQRVLPIWQRSKN